MKKKALALALALTVTTSQSFSLAVDTYSIDSDTSIVAIEPQTLEVQLSYQVDGKWHDIGFADLTVTLDVDKTELAMAKELKTEISFPLTDEQKAEIQDQVPPGIEWKVLKYVGGDEGLENKRPWHLDGELDGYPVGFFLRIDRTFVGGAQPESQYYPSHSTEWDMMTWGLVSGFVEPEPNGYDVIMEAANIEDVKERFKAVDEVIMVGPDLKDPNCNLRQVIIDKYHVAAEDLDAGKIDVLWYVSKVENQCPDCLYHVDGVVYYTDDGVPVDPDVGYLEITHEYYVEGEQEPEFIEQDPKIEAAEVKLNDYRRDKDTYVYKYAAEGEDILTDEVIKTRAGETRAIRMVYERPRPTAETPVPSPSPQETAVPTPSPSPPQSPAESALPQESISPSPLPVETSIPSPTPSPSQSIIPSPPAETEVPSSSIAPVEEPDFEPDRDEEPEAPPSATQLPLVSEEPVIEDFVDPDVPLAALPEPSPFEEIEIEEEDVPMAQVPQTGDNMGLWLSLFALVGLELWAINKKKSSFDI